MQRHLLCHPNRPLPLPRLVRRLRLLETEYPYRPKHRRLGHRLWVARRTHLRKMAHCHRAVYCRIDCISDDTDILDGGISRPRAQHAAPEGKGEGIREWYNRSGRI